MGEWFEGGLRFTCTRCGNCCSGKAGTGGEIRVSDDEARGLAARLSLSIEAFRGIYTRALDDGSTSLRERPDGDCVFFRAEQGCTVYADRPRQCRTWPFWRATLATRGHWEAAGAGCPGIGRGERRTADEIRAARADDGTSGWIPPAKSDD